jgi:hypothetical protein
MRRRWMLGLASAVCAFALMVGPALAAPQFKASRVAKEITPSESAREKGANREGERQEFKFGAFKINCEFAKAKGRVGFEESKTLFLSVHFKNCVALAKVGNQPITLKAKFKSPWDFEYHSNGFAEIGSESESELRLLRGGSIEMTVPSIKCLIEVPSQTVPLKAEKKPEAEYSSVLYANETVAVAPGKKFPTGEQKQLLITNELKKFEYELSEGQCEEFKKTEGKNSFYKGVIKDEVIGGNLSIG